MVGVGYDAAGQTVYLHDTWDNSTHSMTWGGSYHGMAHQAMTAIHLASVLPPEVAVTGNDVNIGDSDTTPSTADGTDFGSMVQGSAGGEPHVPSE